MSLHEDGEGIHNAESFVACVAEKKEHSLLHYAIYTFLNKVHGFKMETFNDVSKCITRDTNVHSIER